MGRFKDGLAESVTMGSAVFARDYLAPVWQPIHYLLCNIAICRISTIALALHRT